jgi:hypothetical protein
LKALDKDCAGSIFIKKLEVEWAKVPLLVLQNENENLNIKSKSNIRKQYIFKQE